MVIVVEEFEAIVGRWKRQAASVDQQDQTHLASAGSVVFVWHLLGNSAGLEAVNQRQ